MSQRAKVLWVIAFAIFPLVALSGFTIWQQYLRDEALVSSERTYFAQATAFAAEAFLDGQVMAARALAKHPRPETLAADNPDWQGMRVVGPEALTSPVVSPARLVDGKPALLITIALDNRQGA